MSAKDQFLRNKDLAGKWNQFSKEETWASVKIHAQARMMEMGPTQEMIKGGAYLIHILDTLAEGDDTNFEYPSPGLHHMADKMPDKKE